jgi:drug/metabolite transporter (DMT)-like permease
MTHVSAPARPATRARTTGLVVAIASALAFASSGPMVKPLLEAGWSLGAALLLRLGGGALLLSPFLVRAVLRERSFLRRHWLLITGFGLTGVAGVQLFYFAAMQRMPVGIALLIEYLAPVLIVVWVWVRTRRRPSAVVMGGTIAASTGLVLVVDITGARFDPLGTILALGAAVCLAAYFVIAERTGDDVPALALAGGGLVVGALLMGALCVVGILPFAAPAVDVSYAGFAVPWWAAAAWVVIVSTALGYALGVIAVPFIGARLASFVGLTEVLFATGFAWLLLGEQVSAVQLAGGALILLGVVLVRLDPVAPPRGEAAIVPVVPAP